MTPDELPGAIGRAAIAVKSHHTAAAAGLLAAGWTRPAYVVSFQNGLTADAITAVTGPGALVASFVNFGADLLAPGRIMQGNVGTFRVGEPGGGPITPRVAELAEALPYAEATDNIMGYLWGKEAYGAMLFAGAVSPLSIAETLEDPRWRPLMLAIAREVLAQAPVTPEGFDGFEPDDLEGSLDRLVAFNRGSAKSHSGDLPGPGGPPPQDRGGRPAGRAGRPAHHVRGRADPGHRARRAAAARWPTSSCWPPASAPSGSAARCAPWSASWPAPPRAGRRPAARPGRRGQGHDRRRRAPARQRQPGRHGRAAGRRATPR